MAGTAGGPQRGRRRIRASHAERDDAIAELRERFAVGQLSQDTFVYRMEAALAARHRDELADLLADLPRARRLRLPGWDGLMSRRALITGALRSARDAWSRHAWSRRPGPGTGSPPAWLTFPAGSQPSFVIGRDPDCDLVIADLTVSRRHAGLDSGPGGWLLTDLGSTNGTRLNGWRVRDAVPVRPGDLVSFGDASFIMRATSDALAEPAGADSSGGR